MKKALAADDSMDHITVYVIVNMYTQTCIIYSYAIKSILCPGLPNLEQDMQAKLNLTEYHKKVWRNRGEIDLQNTYV